MRSHQPFSRALLDAVLWLLSCSFSYNITSSKKSRFLHCRPSIKFKRLSTEHKRFGYNAHQTENKSFCWRLSLTARVNRREIHKRNLAVWSFRANYCFSDKNIQFFEKTPQFARKVMVRLEEEVTDLAKENSVGGRNSIFVKVKSTIKRLQILCMQKLKTCMKGLHNEPTHPKLSKLSVAVNFAWQNIAV